MRTATLTPPDAACAVAGADLSFDAVYDEHVDFVWRSAVRLGVGAAAADDVVQQVFLVVHRRLRTFAGRSSLKTWLFSILLRVVREHGRGVRRKSPHLAQPSIDPDSIADGGNNPYESLSHAEALRLIDELLQSLDYDKRIVFVLAEIEEMTAHEIGDVTGLTEQAVYSRLRAARTDFERAAAAVRRRGLGGPT